MCREMEVMQQRSPVGCKLVILRLHGMHPGPLCRRDLFYAHAQYIYLFTYLCVCWHNASSAFWAAVCV